VHFDRLRRHDVSLGQICLHSFSLIALQLNNSSEFFVSDHSSVATKLLSQPLQCLVRLLFRQSLHNRKTLLAASFLNPQMHITFLTADRCCFVEFRFRIKTPLYGIQGQRIGHKNGCCWKVRSLPRRGAFYTASWLQKTPRTHLSGGPWNFFSQRPTRFPMCLPMRILKLLL